jgi:hypothetical protein
VSRAGGQAPCPKPPVDLLDAERQYAIIRDRRGDRPEMRYAWREGIKGGGHRFLRLYSFPLCSATKSNIARPDHLGSSFRDGTHAIRSGDKA